MLCDTMNKNKHLSKRQFLLYMQLFVWHKFEAKGMLSDFVLWYVFEKDMLLNVGIVAYLILTWFFTAYT